MSRGKRYKEEICPLCLRHCVLFAIIQQDSALWAELGDDKVAVHYRGVSVCLYFGGRTGLRRASSSHMTAWSDDTEHYVSRGRSG